MQLLTKNRTSTPLVVEQPPFEVVSGDDFETEDIDAAASQWLPAGDIRRCDKCGENFLWRDASGQIQRGAGFVWLDRAGGRHCVECEEPPSFAMVARVVYVDRPRDDGSVWMIDQTEMCMPIWRADRERQMRARREAEVAAMPDSEFLD